MPTSAGSSASIRAGTSGARRSSESCEVSLCRTQQARLLLRLGRSRVPSAASLIHAGVVAVAQPAAAVLVVPPRSAWTTAAIRSWSLIQHLFVLRGRYSRRRLAAWRRYRRGSCARSWRRGAEDSLQPNGSRAQAPRRRAFMSCDPETFRPSGDPRGADTSDSSAAAQRVALGLIRWRPRTPPLALGFA
jgi:hypothetical protein